jgi:KDO2-lipid IV(A) lauroyltransferase
LTSRPPLRKRVKRFLRFQGIRLLVFLVRLLPFSTALALGRGLGGLGYRLFGKDRRLALAHLAKALPERAADHEAIVRQMFRNLGEGAAELTHLDRIDIRSYVSIEPSTLATLNGILAAGKGAVVVTGHIGNWELFFRRFLVEGFDARAVGKEQADPRLTAWMEELRGPGRTIWRGSPSAARQLLKTLRENGVLAMLIDQDTKVQGVFVPFFGDLAWTPRAAAELALRTGAGVAAFFAHRRPDGGHVVTGGPVAYEPTGDREADVVGLTAAMTKAIEDHIRRAPAEWVWMHRRWKTRPVG